MRRGMVLGLLLALGGLAAVKAQPPAADAPKVDRRREGEGQPLRAAAAAAATPPCSSPPTASSSSTRRTPAGARRSSNKIKELTPKPVTTLINTHTHGDHVSGNVEFPATIDFIAQENTKANMEKMPIFKEHNGVGMAKRTFKDKMTIGKGADQIDLYYFGRGHTNGDAWVVFPALRIVHAGDIFASKAVPLIDSDNGGSMLHIHEYADEGVQRDQERGHDHQRPHADADDVGRPEGVRRLQQRLPDVGAGRTEGRQDAGAARR